MLHGTARLPHANACVDQVTLRRRGVGVIAHDPARSAGGYTLIAPQTDSGNIYLVDMDGNAVY